MGYSIDSVIYGEYLNSKIKFAGKISLLDENTEFVQNALTFFHIVMLVCWYCCNNGCPVGSGMAGPAENKNGLEVVLPTI